MIEPRLRGEPEPLPELTLAEFVELYLERHAATVRARTIATLRDRLRHSLAAFGDVPLHELERMPDVIAGWPAKLPSRAGHGIAQAAPGPRRCGEVGEDGPQPGQARRL